jgi:hypothetical protein
MKVLHKLTFAFIATNDVEEELDLMHRGVSWIDGAGTLAVAGKQKCQVRLSRNFRVYICSGGTANPYAAKNHVFSLMAICVIIFKHGGDASWREYLGVGKRKQSWASIGAELTEHLTNSPLNLSEVLFA